MKRKYPNPTKKWSWVCSSGEGAYLQCRLFKKYGFEHRFFTNEWHKKGPKDLVNLVNPELSIHLVKQIHSSNIINSSEAYFPIRTEADGLISNQIGESLWIYSADCIPIFFADPRKRFTAAIHAGWRGISKGILGKALDKLERLGSKRNEIIVALGPAISKNKYEVELQVMQATCEDIFGEDEHKPLTLEARINKIFTLGIASYANDSGKFLLDIRKAAAHHLYYLGIRKEQISISNLCTYSNPKLFNSWRRDYVKSAQWSMISS